MTSRERIETTLRHIEPDRTPIFEYVLLPPIADYILGRKYIDYANNPDDWLTLAGEMGWENAVRQYVADRVELAEILGHDMLYVTPCPPEAAVTHRAAPAAPSLEDASAGDPVERIEQRNRAQEQAPSGFPDDIFLVYEFIRAELTKREMDLPILAPAYAHGIWTDVDLMQTMLLAPEVAHRHFSFATDSALKLIERYLGLDLDLIGVGGDFAGNRPLISPKAYREFIVPEIRLLTSRIHRAGKYAVNTSDGNLWSVIDDFLISCSADGYLEIDSNAGMDLLRLKAAYGSRITFFGNMDCGNVLSFSSPSEIRSATFQCLEDGYGNGGHVFCAGNAITASVPTANYLAMVNAYRERFSLPEFTI